MTTDNAMRPNRPQMTQVAQMLFWIVLSANPHLPSGRNELCLTFGIVTVR